MREPNRAVFLKQSGELLEGPDTSDHWQSAAKVAAELAKAYNCLEQFNIVGLTLVPGGGNIARGVELRSQNVADRYADVIGRWATIGNAIVLAGALEAQNVPVELFISDKMTYRDASINLTPYSAEKLAEAHQQGKVAIIGGGSGEDNATTDYAVALYARDYARVYDGPITVLKSTKFDGVYESDPAKAAAGAPPARYVRLSAQMIRDNYQKLKAVDERSLEQLIDGHLSMLVYSDAKHDLSEVLEVSGQTQPPIGTLIVSEDSPPVLA